MTASFEVAAMRQAIAVSALGLGTTSPNPPVGCVILDEHGNTVGAGYHRRKGEAHAEVQALAAAGASARGGTAVVTLEPCNHVGVTPACRQELLDAGVVKVIISLMDPTSRGDGGAAVLEAAGVEVRIGLLADEARLVLGPWLAATVRKRPYVTLAYASAEAGSRRLDAAISDLRQESDAVIFTADHVEEGVPAGHGAGRFALPNGVLHISDPSGYLAHLYGGGVRTVLLIGQPPLTAAFLAAEVIDRVIALQPPRATASFPSDSSTADIPDNFVLTNVHRVAGGGILLEAHQKPEACSQ